MKLNLLDQVPDEYTRKNFKDIQSAVNASPILNGNFKHFQIELTQAVSNHKVRHNLGFLPKDVILTSSQGPGTVTFNYADFNSNEISLTTTNSVTIRFFLGSVK